MTVTVILRIYTLNKVTEITSCRKRSSVPSARVFYNAPARRAWAGLDAPTHTRSFDFVALPVLTTARLRRRRRPEGGGGSGGRDFHLTAESKYCNIGWPFRFIKTYIFYLLKRLSFGLLICKSYLPFWFSCCWSCSLSQIHLIEKTKFRLQ